jgi:hypothetical protein
VSIRKSDVIGAQGFTLNSNRHDGRLDSGCRRPEDGERSPQEDLQKVAIRNFVVVDSGGFSVDSNSEPPRLGSRLGRGLCSEPVAWARSCVVSPTSAVIEGLSPSL